MTMNFQANRYSRCRLTLFKIIDVEIEEQLSIEDHFYYGAVQHGPPQVD